MNQNHMRDSEDRRVPRLLVGQFHNLDLNEPIQIEYRYVPNVGFDLFTRIQNHDYSLSGAKYFDVMSELLDQLPLSSKIVIQHWVMIHAAEKREIVGLEEHMYPYEVRNAATVVYQLKLTYQGTAYETHRSTAFGGSGGTLGGVLEELRRIMGQDFVLGICYFCEKLIDINTFGGTDYRHDQLYCLRDTPQALAEIGRSYPKLRDQESLVSVGTRDMSALHGCSAFSYAGTPRP
jgi:hypothetical protein